MQEQIKLESDGQITLPNNVRRYLDAKDGDVLEFEFTDKGILIKAKSRDIQKKLDKYVGIFPSDNTQTQEQVLEKSRRERGWDKEDELLFDAWANE